jgi:transcriptional regulator GlxA family with amidase domain
MDTHYEISGWLDRLNGMGFAIQHVDGYVRRHDGSFHTHDVLEIAYIVSGSGTHRHGTTAYPIGPGSLGIMHYTQPHDIDTGGEPMSVINLYLDLARFELPDLGEDLAAGLYRILPRHPSLKHRHNQFVHLRFAPGGEQEALLWAMLAEQERRSAGWREAMRSQLRLFLIACVRQALAQEAAAPADEPGRPEPKLERLLRALDADPAQEVSLDRLAEELGWSRSHLCRAFKRHTGATISAYVQRQRIAAAMARLRTTRDSVLDVALACGFNDPSYFNRAFRAVAGTTPRAYRRSVGVGL